MASEARFLSNWPRKRSPHQQSNSPKIRSLMPLHRACRIAAEIPSSIAHWQKRRSPESARLAGPRRTTSPLERVHIAAHRCFSQQPKVEWCSSWLRREPGHKVTHGRKIRCGCFRIASSQSFPELLKDRRIIVPRSHLFPNFLSKRFSDKILGRTSAFSLLRTTMLSVGKGGTWPRMIILRQVSSDKLTTT